jgi:hypothetical protein
MSQDNCLGLCRVEQDPQTRVVARCRPAELQGIRGLEREVRATEDIASGTKIGFADRTGGF